MNIETFKILFPILILASCSSTENLLTELDTDDRTIYREAVSIAIYPDSAKMYNSLTPIVSENTSLVWNSFEGTEYVLMLSWKSDSSFYNPYVGKTYNTDKYEIWVTAAPMLYKKIKEEDPKNLDRRLQQLLGLPPNSEYKYFIEFWVKPKDLFRPCPDNEITDTMCGLVFPSNTDSTYINWINDNRISRYYHPELYNQYPWTQLGYTFDWNPSNQSHIGLSEFVIREHSDVIVKAIHTTEAYFETPGK